MRIFLTGATGFVGGFVLRELKKQGYKVRCLVRDFEQAETVGIHGVEAVIADITDAKSLHGVLTNCDAVIHLAAIIEEKGDDITFERVNVTGTRNILYAAREQGANRFIHTSVLGAAPDSDVAYLRSKGVAEKLVRESGLVYTIFRPSFIFGPGDAVYTTLAKAIRKAPLGLFPLFGAGRCRHQPVSVFDLARGMVNSIAAEKAFQKTYDVGGPEPISFREQVRIVGGVIGEKVRGVWLPLWFGRLVVGAVGRFRFAPIDSDRLAMLTTDSVCDPTPFVHDLNVSLQSFRHGVGFLADS